jgi:adenine-specific DNA-methyltransferase
LIIDKKNTGSYYTPSYLAEFISKRVLNYFENRTRISILEPSVGDGAFLESINKHKNLSVNIAALDINSGELEKAKNKWTSKGEFIKKDFLEYVAKRKFSAVIGNPPYIKKNRLKEKQITLSKLIHKNEKLSEKSVKNIWATFLVKSITHLTKNGVLAFILPSELLQVSYAKEIRNYLKKQFERIEIFTFNDLMFECKGQDTIVLFAYKKAIYKGEFFVHINSASQLDNNNFELKENLSLIENNSKWTHHFLSNEELTFIYKLKNRLHNIGYYIESKPGIVTAANKFFIVDEKTEKEYNLSNYTIPIIQKGLFVNGSVVFNNEDYLEIETANLPSKLLRLKNEDRISKKLNEYLTEGERLEIPNRYKCRIRDKWYVIPNIAKKPDAFFFKRSHNYPKLLKNNSDAFVTDSAYKVEMKKNFDLNSFIYSFYNSLTILFAEIEGRYYGGGVLELVPSEFKKLPLPYLEIDENEFNNFTTEFDNKKNIDEILAINDFNILNTTLGLYKNEIEKIERIRLKLLNKRTRRKANA